MKIAIVQDELVRRGGAEQVVLSFMKAFPDSTLYTLSYNSEGTYPEFKRYNIKTSWFGKLIKNETALKLAFLPLGIYAMEALNLEEYDVILQSTTHCAKYVKVNPKALVVTYCHTPFRLAWRPNSYETVANANRLTSRVYKSVIKLLKRIDLKHSKRTDYFITNSREVVPRITKAYAPKKEIEIINPPVKAENFYVSNITSDYYLLVSRLEPYKKADLVIEAFNELPNKKLIIIGKGSKEKDLKKIAGSNISFKSGLSLDELSRYYSQCKALIFPQHEDYGITPLEANASGRPVIAYGVGGVLDTMIPLKNDASRATALFFEEQTKDAIISSIKRFETLTFDPAFIRQHALRFDEPIFVGKIKSFVLDKFVQHFQ